MKRIPLTAAALAAAAVASAAAGAVVARLRSTGAAALSHVPALPQVPGLSHVPGLSRVSTGTARDRWHSVTINRAPEQVGALPAPLGDLGRAIEVRVRPAPGGRGTELAARIQQPVPEGLGSVAARRSDEDPVRDLRRALREARQLAEVGEVLLPDTPPTTERTATGAPLAYVTGHARAEGRL